MIGDALLLAALKRRSWHVERVAARYLATLEGASSMPSFDRSLSSDSTLQRQTGEQITEFDFTETRIVNYKLVI